MENYSDRPNGAVLDVLIEPVSVYDNWVVPTVEALEKEYNVEYQHHIQHEFGRIWPTFNDFVTAASNGELIMLTEQSDQSVANRSHTTNMESLVRLVSTYRSWPEYRNMETLKDMIMRFKLNKPMTMPIILNTSEGWFLMSGNTKLDIAFMMGVEPKALVLTI